MLASGQIESVFLSMRSFSATHAIIRGVCTSVNTPPDRWKRRWGHRGSGWAAAFILHLPLYLPPLSFLPSLTPLSPICLSISHPILQLCPLPLPLCPVSLPPLPLSPSPFSTPSFYPLLSLFSLPSLCPLSSLSTPSFHLFPPLSTLPLSTSLSPISPQKNKTKNKPYQIPCDQWQWGLTCADR